MESNSPTHKLTHMNKGSQGCVSKIRVTYSTCKSDNFPEGDLKENDHRCDNISTEFTPDAEVLPDSQAQETSHSGKGIQENKITNSLVRNNDRGSDGSSSEHDYYELENSENEQEEMERSRDLAMTARD